MGILFSRNPIWSLAKANGSDAQVDRGMGPTKRNPMHCNVQWFAGDATIILDGGGEWAPDQISEVHATWELSTDTFVLNAIDHGFIVIACERAFGGLHTRRRGACASIFFNDQTRDHFGLMHIPEGHTDFFHRHPVEPDLPELWELDRELAACRTMYSWLIRKEQFRLSDTQVVSVVLDSEVRWDIDYVALLLCRFERKLRPWVSNFLLAVLGAIIGAFTTVLIGKIL